jgi:hypothetical protein
VGCPDRRIDRLCITCCSPSQPSHHAGLADAISPANGYADHSPGHYGLVSGFVGGVALTVMFRFIIMGSTHGKAPVRIARVGGSVLPRTGLAKPYASTLDDHL